MTDIYQEIKDKMFDICRSKNLLSQPVRVHAKVLTTEQAIGNPGANDYPLQKGKEKLMQVEFFKSVGQAFTDQYGDFEGTLESILNSNLDSNFKRAIFASTINAVLRHLNKIDKTIHCRDKEPTDCAAKLAAYIKWKYNVANVGLIGFQPRMVESLASQLSLRVLDMDQDNIGVKKCNITIEAKEKTDEVVKWASVLVVTGTTLVNTSIVNFLNKKPLIFYGTTIAGAAHLMNLERFCPMGH